MNYKTSFKTKGELLTTLKESAWNAVTFKRNGKTTTRVCSVSPKWIEKNKKKHNVNVKMPAHKNLETDSHLFAFDALSSCWLGIKPSTVTLVSKA